MRSTRGRSSIAKDNVIIRASRTAKKQPMKTIKSLRMTKIWKSSEVFLRINSRQKKGQNRKESAIERHPYVCTGENQLMTRRTMYRTASLQFTHRRPSAAIDCINQAVRANECFLSRPRGMGVVLLPIWSPVIRAAVHSIPKKRGEAITSITIAVAVAIAVRAILINGP
jgi:hypothetical protein